MAMIRSFFVPARSSRHRVAAIALYRALVRSGQQIPLPKDLQHSGPIHPVVHLVRKRFANNTMHTSIRLVYASMTAGYKFLSLFSKAQTQGSPEHSQILQHLRKRNETASHSRSVAPPRMQRKPYSPPLLTKTSLPYQPPEYQVTTRPLPKAALSGQRKVPHVVATAEGVPFLRTKKPQPRVLSKAISRKTRILHSKIYGVVKIEEEDFAIADQEDRWDRFVRKVQRAEGSVDQVEPFTELGTYRWSQELSKLWLEYKLDTSWQDFSARGKALQRLVEEEGILAQKEQQASTGAGTAETISKALDKVHLTPTTQPQEQTSVPFQDPFTADQWVEKVERAESLYLGIDAGKPSTKTGDNPGSGSWMIPPSDLSGRMRRFSSKGKGRRESAESEGDPFDTMRKGRFN